MDTINKIDADAARSRLLFAQSDQFVALLLDGAVGTPGNQASPGITRNS